MASETTPPLAPSDRELLERARLALVEWNKNTSSMLYAPVIHDITARLAADEDAELRADAITIIRAFHNNDRFSVGKYECDRVISILKARDARRKEQTDGR